MEAICGFVGWSQTIAGQPLPVEVTGPLGRTAIASRIWAIRSWRGGRVPRSLSSAWYRTELLKVVRDLS